MESCSRTGCCQAEATMSQIISQSIVTVEEIKKKLIGLNSSNIDLAKVKLVLQILVQIVIPAIQNIIDMIEKAVKEKG